jgi:GT2 family glycosyltransferase
MYYEDVDLFFRAFLGGGRGWLLPEWTVFHHEGGSIRRYEDEARNGPGFRSKTFLLIRNRVYFLVKNCPADYFGLAWPLLLLEFFRSLAYHLVRGELGVFLRAHAEALRHLGAMRAKRRITQKNRVIPFGRLVSALRG